MNTIFILDSSGSIGTSYRVDSQDSTVSQDLDPDWKTTRQHSVSLSEWHIPYEELRIGDKIGAGRFSTGIERCRINMTYSLFYQTAY